MIKHGISVDSQHSCSSEIDEVVSFVSLPFCLDEVRILCSDSKYHVDDGKPFRWRLTPRSSQESGELVLQVDTPNKGERWVDSGHVGHEEHLRVLLRWHLIGVDGFVGRYSHVIKVVARILYSETFIGFGKSYVGLGAGARSLVSSQSSRALMHALGVRFISLGSFTIFVLLAKPLHPGYIGILPHEASGFGTLASEVFLGYIKVASRAPATRYVRFSTTDITVSLGFGALNGSSVGCGLIDIELSSLYTLAMSLDLRI